MKKRKTLSLSEAKKHLFQLADDVTLSGEPLLLTREGKEPLLLMTLEVYEEWQETLEILGDPALMHSLQRGLKDIQQHKTVTLRDVVPTPSLSPAHAKVHRPTLTRSSKKPRASSRSTQSTSRKKT